MALSQHHTLNSDTCLVKPQGTLTMTLLPGAVTLAWVLPLKSATFDYKRQQQAPIPTT
jgi:hypothetical protein